MPVTVILHNETSITNIANRLYANLTAESRRVAETGLLKLNPVLADANGLKPGVIINLPDIPSLIPKTEQINDDPTAQTKEVIKNAINTYGDQLKERIKTQQNDLHSQTKLLDNVTKEIDNYSNKDDLQERIKTLKDSLDTSMKKTKDDLSGNLNKMFEQILADLSK